MDLDLMISSFPKLLNATLITLKLLTVSLVITKETVKSFKVIKVALSNFGKLLIIKSRSINILCYI